MPAVTGPGGIRRRITKRQAVIGATALATAAVLGTSVYLWNHRNSANESKQDIVLGVNNNGDDSAHNSRRIIPLQDPNTYAATTKGDISCYNNGQDLLTRKYSSTGVTYNPVGIKKGKLITCRARNPTEILDGATLYRILDDGTSQELNSALIDSTGRFNFSLPDDGTYRAALVVAGVSGVADITFVASQDGTLVAKVEEEPNDTEPRVRYSSFDTPRGGAAGELQ